MLHDIARRCQLPANTPAQDPNLSGQTHMVPGTLVPQQPSGGHGTAQGAFSNKVLGRGAVLTRAREQGREAVTPPSQCMHQIHSIRGESSLQADSCELGVRGIVSVADAQGIDGFVVGPCPGPALGVLLQAAEEASFWETQPIREV